MYVDICIGHYFHRLLTWDIVIRLDDRFIGCLLKNDNAAYTCILYGLERIYIIKLSIITCEFVILNDGVFYFGYLYIYIYKIVGQSGEG